MDKNLNTTTSEPAGDFPYFRRTWNAVVVTLLTVAFVPLIIIGGGMYAYLTWVIQQKTVATLRVDALDLRDAVDQFLAERTVDLKLISENIGLSGLRDPQTLQNVFNSLQQQLPCYTDLGVIDDQGRHLAYAGSYDLLRVNYRQAEWFETAIAHGVYISDVFLGHRNAPHFVIAVKATDSDGVWLLRATIDTDYFHRMIAAMVEKSNADAYFVNRRGVYQSKPSSTGQLMEPSRLTDLQPFEGVRFLEAKDHLLMTVWLKNVPWLCAVQMDRKQAFAELKRIRIIGIWVFALAAVLIVMTVLLTTNYLVSRLEVKRRSIRQLDRRLRHSNRLASAMELALGFFREIKDALTNIDAAAMNIQGLGSCNPAREVADSLSQIRSETARSSRSIDNFLRFTRSAEPIIKDLNLNALLDDLLEFMDKELRFNNIDVVRNFEDSVPAVQSDPAGLRQVFQNLILNAVAAVQTNGSITLTTRLQAEEVIVTIADTGPGIPEEHLAQIFEPLFSTKPGGTGLGLPICVDIIEHLGGRITANNRPEGGACFVVSLPIQFNPKCSNS